MLDGYKTYGIGWLTVIFAVLGVALGKLTMMEAAPMFSTGLGLVALRATKKLN